MQIDVHRIDAKVARPHPAHDRVEVRAVAINERADGVDGIGDVLQFAFEQPARVGIGDHYRGNITVFRPAHTQARLERGPIDPALGCRRDRLDPVTGEGCGGRVGAVRAFGHQHHRARIAPRLERGANAQQPA